MKVYRYLSEDELNHMLSGRINRLGSNFSSEYSANTHKYKRGVRYLHFFLKKDSIKYIQELHDASFQDYYTATFNIPMLTLMRFRGKGRYQKCRIFINSEIVQPIEFAIPVDEFDVKYLVDYKLDEDHHKYVEGCKNLLKNHHFTGF